MGWFSTGLFYLYRKSGLNRPGHLRIWKQDGNPYPSYVGFVVNRLALTIMRGLNFPLVGEKTCGVKTFILSLFNMKMNPHDTPLPFFSYPYFFLIQIDNSNSFFHLSPTSLLLKFSLQLNIEVIWEDFLKMRYLNLQLSMKCCFTWYRYQQMRSGSKSLAYWVKLRTPALTCLCVWKNKK